MDGNDRRFHGGVGDMHRARRRRDAKEVPKILAPGSRAPRYLSLMPLRWRQHLTMRPTSSNGIFASNSIRIRNYSRVYVHWRCDDGMTMIYGVATRVIAIVRGIGFPILPASVGNNNQTKEPGLSGLTDLTENSRFSTLQGHRWSSVVLLWL